MPLPLVPIALAAGAAAYFFMKGSGSSAGAKVAVPTSAAPGSTLAPGRGLYDPSLPLDLEQMTTAMLQSDNVIQDLVDAGSALLPDFPIASARLFAKAASLTPPGMVTPPPALPLPAPTLPAPVVPPPASVAPPPPPTVDPSTGVVTLPVITITPTPSSNTVPQWDNSWPVPDVSGVPIPENYAAESSESAAIQSTLNVWALAVAADTVPYVPLTTDGLYGPRTQAVVACFQVWANQTKSAGLAVDGLAGPDTQNYLLDFIPPGTSFPTDGGY